MKEICLKLSGLGALLICLPVIWRIHQGDLFNPASYFLWSLLSLVCVIVLLRDKKGGHTMMVGYVASDFLIGLYAYLKSGKVAFGKFEWFIIGITLTCVCIWLRCEWRKKFTKNLKPAVIANATACMLAGIPQIIDSFQSPYSMSFVICSLYMLVSVLAYYGEERTLNGQLIPGLSILYWIVIMWGLLVARFVLAI